MQVIWVVDQVDIGSVDGVSWSGTGCQSGKEDCCRGDGAQSLSCAVIVGGNDECLQAKIWSEASCNYGNILYFAIALTS